MASPCLFCRIVGGEVPSTVVLDRERLFAFRDIAPAAPVHVLIVPKEHVKDATEITPEHAPLVAAMFEAATEIAAREGLTESGYRLIFNVGPDAGQTIYHLHMHLVGGKDLGAVAR